MRLGILLCGGILLLTSGAIAKGVASRLSVQGELPHRLLVQFESAPLGVRSFRVLHQESEISSKLKPVDRDLWILVDQSKLCETFQMQKYFDQIAPLLKLTRGEQSRVSVTLYSSGRVNAILSKVKRDDLKRLNVRCQKSAVSSSYEEALQLLIQQNQEKLAQTDVWIFSSGNISLSKHIQEKIRSSGLKAFVALYNPHVLNAVETILDQQPVRYGLVTDLERQHYFPHFSTRLELTGDLPESDGPLGLKIQGLNAEGEVLEMAETEFLVPTSAFRRLLDQFQVYVWVGIFLILAVLFSEGIRRKIKKRTCPHCQKRRSTAEMICFFCEWDDAAYLLDEKVSREDLIPLRKNGVTIGSARSSNVRVFHPKRQKVIYQVRKATLRNGKSAFRLMKVDRSSSFFILVNGCPVTHERLLGHQDRLDIQGRFYRWIYSPKNTSKKEWMHAAT